MEPHASPSSRHASILSLAAVTRALFSRRRKTLTNALLAYGGVTPPTAGDALRAAGLDPSRRPETLSIAELCRLTDVLGREPGPESSRAAATPVL